jgi:hypothetical protein
MKVRVLTDFDAYTAGAEFDWDRGYAELLIQRGLIEEVKEDEPLETATAESAADERAMIDHKHGRKKR